MNAIETIKQANATRRKALANLHTELGFESPQALAHAIAESAGVVIGRAIRPISRGAVVAYAAPGPSFTVDDIKDRPSVRGSGKRLSTKERQAIIRDLKAGVTGTECQRKHGVSYPTVHEIKKSLGLATARPRKGRK